MTLRLSGGGRAVGPCIWGFGVVSLPVRAPDDFAVAFSAITGRAPPMQS